MDSKILSEVQIESLLHLIGFESNPFTLLWKGSRDGFEASKFHSLCDGKPKTLTIVKTTSGCIFGGYTSVPWTSTEGYKQDDTAFIFTLECVFPRKKTFKLNVTAGNLYAVNHNSSYGPTFGDGADLYVSNLSNKNSKRYNKTSDSYSSNQTINLSNRVCEKTQ